MSGRFVIQKSKDGKFYFFLRAGNGEVLVTSETYTSKAAAKNGIESVKANAKDSVTVDMTE